MQGSKKKLEASGEVESLLESLLDVFLHCHAIWMDKVYTRPLGSVTPGSRSIAQFHALFAEHILESCIVRLDHKFLEGFGALNEGGVNLETGRKCWRFWESTLEIQFWKQDSLHHRISLESHLTSGECCASQGHPRMMSMVGPSSTRKEIVSRCKQPTCRGTGGD